MKNEKEMLEEKSVEEVKEEMNEPTVLNEELNLRDIVSTIDENPKPLIDMTAYEEEQEQKAIISYDELIRDVNNKSISYDKEELVDDVIPVKRIQMNMELPKRKETIIQDLNLTQKEPKIEIEPIQSTSKLFSFTCFIKLGISFPNGHALEHGLTLQLRHLFASSIIFSTSSSYRDFLSFLWIRAFRGILDFLGIVAFLGIWGRSFFPSFLFLYIFLQTIFSKNNLISL